MDRKRLPYFRLLLIRFPSLVSSLQAAGKQKAIKKRRDCLYNPAVHSLPMYG